MARALEEQQTQRDIESFSFEERLGLFLDRESTLRDSKLLAARLRRAKLKLDAGLRQNGVNGLDGYRLGDGASKCAHYGPYRR